MERYTYEIIFTRLDGQPDEIQQHTSEELARECFRLFDEPDSAEMYSKIYSYQNERGKEHGTLHLRDYLYTAGWTAG